MPDPGCAEESDNSVGDLRGDHTILCNIVCKDSLGNVTFADNPVPPVDTSITPLSARVIKGGEPIKGLRVMEGLRGPKRGTSASPRNTDSDKLSEITEDGSPVARSQKKSKVAKLNTSPDSIGSDNPTVTGDFTVGASVSVTRGLDVTVVFSDDDGTTWCKAKKGKLTKKGKTSVGGRRTPVRSSISKTKADSEDRDAVSFADSVAPSHMVAMTSSALGACAFEWADDLDDCRAKSRNLQGSVSGAMKRNIKKNSRT